VKVHDGFLYWTQSVGSRLRRAPLSGGPVETLAGNGSPGYSGDGSLGPFAQVAGPGGLAIAADGTVYLADWSQHIRRIQSIP